MVDSSNKTDLLRFCDFAAAQAIVKPASKAADLIRTESLSRVILKRSALDPIGRSPLLHIWNLDKVELLSTFISHLDDISSWKCSWKC